MFPVIVLLIAVSALVHCVDHPVPDFLQRECQPIRIDMCRGIGYNETAMPNLVGHELQTEVEFTLQTFAPLIQYVCSSQLKLFLCAAYVPMCTPKIQVPIGPCRSLCESVRSRCHPVLQGFGYPWPPALDCNRFPRENNQEAMCMEGPGEAHTPMQEKEYYPGLSGTKSPAQVPSIDCPSHLYVKLHRSGRCAPLCEADILFGQHEKHLADVWVATWSYAALGLALVATLCLILSSDTKNSPRWAGMLTPLLWCHNMATVGWNVRFVSGRTSTACGYDPQLPNVSLLLTDGLSNACCAATFLLRYYFGMAACVWWAILCLAWHRDVRRSSPDANTHITLVSSSVYDSSANSGSKRNRRCASKREYNITESNMARFTAWVLPGLQTAAVIVARLVDADELLGACFVGNQSDKGLQILVATPLFCYWIFGSVNLISGYLVHRRNKQILQRFGSQNVKLQTNGTADSGIGTFLFIYCVPCALLLMAVIYEFTNRDVWLNVPQYVTATEGITTPLWPFLTRAFMELILGIICAAWVLGPKISTIYKRQLTPRTIKRAASVSTTLHKGITIDRASEMAYSTVSYQSVRQHPRMPSSKPHSSGVILMNQLSNYSVDRTKPLSASPLSPTSPRTYPHIAYKQPQKFNRYGKETIF